MTTTLHQRVTRALDSVAPRDGAIVVGDDLRVLAERDPLPGGHAVLIALDQEPPQTPPPRRLALDARHQLPAPVPDEPRRVRRTPPRRAPWEAP